MKHHKLKIKFVLWVWKYFNKKKKKKKKKKQKQVGWNQWAQSVLVNFTGTTTGIPIIIKFKIQSTSYQGVLFLGTHVAKISSFEYKNQFKYALMLFMFFVMFFTLKSPLFKKLSILKVTALLPWCKSSIVFTLTG